MVRVTIATPVLPQSSLVFIASGKKYFTDEGLEATIQPQAHGKIALDAMIQGKADFALSTEYPFMFAVQDGKNICAVADTLSSVKDEAIVARKDRGIRAPADLRGKRIGSYKGTMMEFFLDAFLTVNGIPKNGVKVVYLGPHEGWDALKAGKVDAVATWSPFVTLFQKKLGENGLVFYGEQFYTESFVVSADTEYVRKNPETVTKLVRALVRAEKHVRDAPKESMRIVAEAAKVEYGLLEEIWPIYDFRVGLRQSLLVNMENQARWAIRTGLIGEKEIHNLADHIYPYGLKAVRPDSVTMSH
ncbi:MAG: NrtA/SsuA/CpmA family ABC transporter substrate-binding protein [Deltaproteobacteria bacterium]|nr:NrtA/SsuA/CpmA family ABC transporter substrate-binding protein [Deltaproteobacteria bacterium]